MDIEEGFSPIERAATMSIACETVRLSAPQNAVVETGLYFEHPWSHSNKLFKTAYSFPTLYFTCSK
jgi:hypothetical protein